MDENWWLLPSGYCLVVMILLNVANYCLLSLPIVAKNQPAVELMLTDIALISTVENINYFAEEQKLPLALRENKFFELTKKELRTQGWPSFVDQVLDTNEKELKIRQSIGENSNIQKVLQLLWIKTIINHPRAYFVARWQNFNGHIHSRLGYLQRHQDIYCLEYDKENGTNIWAKNFVKHGGWADVIIGKFYYFQYKYPYLFFYSTYLGLCGICLCLSLVGWRLTKSKKYQAAFFVALSGLTGIAFRFFVSINYGVHCGFYTYVASICSLLILFSVIINNKRSYAK